MAKKYVVREWGNSYGVVLSKEIVQKEKLKPGDEVEVIIKKKTNVFKKTFGILPNWKDPTDVISREVDEELWPDE